MRFFLLQAVAITFEDVVINLASRLGFGKTTRLSKCIGYIWVLVGGFGQHLRGLAHGRRLGVVKWVTIGRASFCVFVTKYLETRREVGYFRSRNQSLEYQAHQHRSVIIIIRPPDP